MNVIRKRGGCGTEASLWIYPQHMYIRFKRVIYFVTNLQKYSIIDARRQTLTLTDCDLVHSKNYQVCFIKNTTIAMAYTVWKTTGEVWPPTRPTDSCRKFLASSFPEEPNLNYWPISRPKGRITLAVRGAAWRCRWRCRLPSHTATFEKRLKLALSAFCEVRNVSNPIV